MASAVESRKSSLTLADQQNLADAVQAGKFKPIDSGIGNGTGGGGTVKWPGKFTATDKGTIADSIKKHKFFPVEGNPNRRAERPRQRQWKRPWQGQRQKQGQGLPTTIATSLWWPIIVGGCYNGAVAITTATAITITTATTTTTTAATTRLSTIRRSTNIVIEQPAVDPAAAAQAALDARRRSGIARRTVGRRRRRGAEPRPAYRLVLGNRGTLPAGNFQLMLMASVDGTPKAGLPMATSEVAGLASRKYLRSTFACRSPPTSRTMTKFIVVVDSAAQIGEPDENNNVAVLDREKIAAIDPTTVAVQ